MGYRAFIIEDNHALADVLRMKLEREGHKVTIAPNQRDAYHLLDEQKFDYILLDLRLPTHAGDMNPHTEVGFDILDHIRDRFTLDQLPVVVMTAYEETSQTAVRSLKALANDYITKPFDDCPVSLDDKLAAITRFIAERSLVQTVKKHKIVYTKECVKINSISVPRRRFVDILFLLGRGSLTPSRDSALGEKPCMTGKEMAEMLRVQEPTIRKNVTRFRKWIADEFERRHLAPIEKNDIIKNVRDRKGYQLNFGTCTICRE